MVADCFTSQPIALRIIARYSKVSVLGSTATRVNISETLGGPILVVLLIWGAFDNSQMGSTDYPKSSLANIPSYLCLLFNPSFILDILRIPPHLLISLSLILPLYKLETKQIKTRWRWLLLGCNRPKSKVKLGALGVQVKLRPWCLTILPKG